MRKRTGESPDYALMLTVFALIIFGLIMVSSASVVIAYEGWGDKYYFLKHQFFYGIIPGVIGWIIAQKINYQHLRKIAFPALVVTLVLLILVFAPGIGAGYKGANRWVNLGLFQFQPTELAKIAFIIYLAAWLSKKGMMVRDISLGFIPFLSVMGVITFLIALQPDIGTLVVIALTGCTVYFVAGGRIRHLFLIALIALVILFLLIEIAPYRKARFTVFLHPEIDPKGVGYQVNQALMAIGSGGIFGLGLGHSRQKYNYLPEPAGDTIFSIIGEELGFIGISVLLVLFFILVIRGFQAASRAPDFFGRFLAVGITSWFIFQALIHIGANLSLIPLTGVPLPFISYGGSALTFSLIGLGILLNVSKHSQ